jgi:Large ribosomal RNA subunit accumulation protein YceD
VAVSIAGDGRAAMKRTSGMTDKADSKTNATRLDATKVDATRVDATKVDPWRVPVIVAQLPDTGLHCDIEADPAARRAMAEVAGLREIPFVSASLDVTPQSGGRVHVAGRVRARVGQTCVVSLDPIESDIDEPIDLIFAPPDQIPQLADLVEEAAESDSEIPDPPEPIVNGAIDLGRLATDALFLGIDPYPRRPDAVFDVPVVAPDPEDHPFAALKALRLDAKPSGSRKSSKQTSKKSPKRPKDD